MDLAGLLGGPKEGRSPNPSEKGPGPNGNSTESRRTAAPCRAQEFPFPAEHQNFFGVDDQLGAVAVSLRREEKEGSSGPQYNYRLIMRTSQVRVTGRAGVSPAKAGEESGAGSGGGDSLSRRSRSGGPWGRPAGRCGQHQVPRVTGLTHSSTGSGRQGPPAGLLAVRFTLRRLRI